MLARGTDLLEEAQAGGWAVPAFSVYNLEQAVAVCRAADTVGAAAILQAGSSAFRYAGRRTLAALALAAAEDAEAPIGVHLDHAVDPDEIRQCIALGYSSVMYDGSALPLEENISRTRDVVVEAHRAGAWVEGELAGFAGEEDRSGVAEAGPLTSAEDAVRFVEETGVDALAAAIGSVHGIPTSPVALDFSRLEEIRSAITIPLVLHGASGLPDAEIGRAIDGGISKINVNTELRRAFRGALMRSCADPPPGDDMASLLDPATDAVCECARGKLIAFGPSSLRRREPKRA